MQFSPRARSTTHDWKVKIFYNIKWHCCWIPYKQHTHTQYRTQRASYRFICRTSVLSSDWRRWRGDRAVERERIEWNVRERKQTNKRIFTSFVVIPFSYSVISFICTYIFCDVDSVVAGFLSFFLSFLRFFLFTFFQLLCEISFFFFKFALALWLTTKP